MQERGVAAGVYKAAKLLGLSIGHDLSVVAYGDSPMLEDGERLPSVQMPLPLTIRASTGPISALAKD